MSFIVVYFRQLICGKCLGFFCLLASAMLIMHNETEVSWLVLPGSFAEVCQGPKMLCFILAINQCNCNKGTTPIGIYCLI